MSATDALTALLRPRIRDVPDFPASGVLFRDITPLLGDPVTLRAAVDALAQVARELEVSRVAAVEARGFIFGAAVAVAAGAGFTPVRKAGKLPGATLSRSYVLEYADAVLEVHADAFQPGEPVLVVDDVLATGGTAAAAAALVAAAGAHVAGVAVLIELAALAGRARLPGIDVRALLTL